MYIVLSYRSIVHIHFYVYLFACYTFLPFQVLRGEKLRLNGNYSVLGSFSGFCHLNWINSLTRRLKIKCKIETRRIAHWKPVIFFHMDTINNLDFF